MSPIRRHGNERFCRYPSPAGRSMPEHFHFAGGWCQGLRGNFLNEGGGPKANFREPSRHMGGPNRRYAPWRWGYLN